MREAQHLAEAVEGLETLIVAAATWVTNLAWGIDRDGPYLLLAGIRAVFVTAATLAYAAHHPFPQGGT
ncbi:MAG: hypothetical protein M1118_09365 [Chloroflexi bacterium]|nr:hypothetical protein [Chloroflexota bacterium]